MTQIGDESIQKAFDESEGESETAKLRQRFIKDLLEPYEPLWRREALGLYSTETSEGVIEGLNPEIAKALIEANAAEELPDEVMDILFRLKGKFAGMVG